MNSRTILLASATVPTGRPRFFWTIPVAVIVTLLSCTPEPAADQHAEPRLPTLSLLNSVQEDGTASELWGAGIAIAIGEDRANELIAASMPLSETALAWYRVLEESLPLASRRAGELVTMFDAQLMDAIVVTGNRGSSDGFGWVPDNIGINVQAFAETYGPPDAGATDRMVRIVAHEYLHLLTYAFYENHAELRQTPYDRALWTIFFEGVGDYVSMSSRWLPDADGNYSPTTAQALESLEPILVERLEALITATDENERELRRGIASGKFDRKWGSLPFGLWLRSETQRCGEANTLRTIMRMERDSVLLLAARYVAPELRPRIHALLETYAPDPDEVIGQAEGCLAQI